MKNVKQIIISTIFLLACFFFSCNQKVKRYEDYNEDDFYEVQGVVTNVVRRTNPFAPSNYKTIFYDYHLELPTPLKGKEANVPFMWSQGDPIVILVHKEDTSISFTGYLGIIDEISIERYIIKTENENEVNKSKSNEKKYEIGDDNHYIVQGIVIRNEILQDSINKTNRRNVHYIYRLDLDKPLVGVDKDIKLIIDEEDPIAVIVHKKDSTISFIGHKGIIDENLLVEYLTKSDSDYEEWFKD
jgi:hypothetical protein